MPQSATPVKNKRNGVIFNAYPDSLGSTLQGALKLLQLPELKNAFCQFYLLPAFFNSDLDRGFSVIDYNLNEDLVQPEDLDELKKLGLSLKLDLVLNHLSINSPQFQELIRSGPASEYADFFIDWNKFWEGRGLISPEGYIIPDDRYLEQLFMRKPGLPLLKVYFPDGRCRFFWNTFYQEVSFGDISTAEIIDATDLPEKEAATLADMINKAMESGNDLLPALQTLKPEQKESLSRLLFEKIRYLGQLDLNAHSEKVWFFYEQTLARLKEYGATLVRLDAFAYLHKEPGLSNFFNRPGTWVYLSRLKEIADRHGLAVLPEIHGQYGSGLHQEMAARGYAFYDFFFPGLVIDALERGNAQTLLAWAEEIWREGYSTVNMLGCHDGIPLLDLKGGTDRMGLKQPGLLSDERIDALVELITSRGGRVKDLYGPDGKKISYYQVNATFFSALGEDESKLLLARAIQMFMPGQPQVWYLDLFAGTNDYAAIEDSGSSGHKEINRTNLCWPEIEKKLKNNVVMNQLKLIRLRNSSPAFSGSFKIHLPLGPDQIHLSWKHEKGWYAVLEADLKQRTFSVTHLTPGSAVDLIKFP
jgi:sucrose phosphorylase